MHVAGPPPEDARIRSLAGRPCLSLLVRVDP
jgi:hypothetical protein